jgi:hypothetical protein
MRVIFQQERVGAFLEQLTATQAMWEMSHTTTWDIRKSE